MGDLLVCSHRGPVAYRPTAEGGVRRERAGPGGLVSVVAPAVEQRSATWCFAPSSPGEAELADAYRLRAGQEPVTYRLLDLPTDAHHDHYRTISTELLMPLFHYLFPLAEAPTFTARTRRAWDGYRLVNERFGAAIREHGGGDGVLVEDVHLMLAAAAFRALPGGGRSDTPLTHFHHVPWCEPDYFGLLPEPIRLEILTGMLAFDSVGFHCRRWADAFAACCERFVAGAVRAGDHVEWHGRTVALVVAPAAVDAGRLRTAAESPIAVAWRRRFEAAGAGRALVVQVERADPSKNTVRGLAAWAALLERRPELGERACLLAVLTAVRTWSEPYRRYLASCQEAVEAVNRRFGRPGRPDPVYLHLREDAHSNDHDRALGALAPADVLVINSLFDGLNIVAMEGLVVGEPALVLSENTGAHALLGADVLSVNPFDVVATADAVERALDMGTVERRRRAAALRGVVAERTPDDWLRERLRSCP